MTRLTAVVAITTTALLVACTKREEPLVEAPTRATQSQLGENLCNIAPPTSITPENSIGGQIALDLSRIAKLGGSGSIGATVNDKVVSLFQAVPERDVVCQMLLQSLACANTMGQREVADTFNTHIERSCHAEKPLNSAARAQALERMNLLNLEIAAQGKQIERLAPETNQKGEAWQRAKANAEEAADSSERTSLEAEARRLEEIYWASYRTEEWFRDEKLKRERELASLKAKVD